MLYLKKPHWEQKNIEELWWTIKRTNSILIRGIAEEETQVKGIENIFKKSIEENFSKECVPRYKRHMECKENRTRNEIPHVIHITIKILTTQNKDWVFKLQERKFKLDTMVGWLGSHLATILTTKQSGLKFVTLWKIMDELISYNSRSLLW